MLRKLPQRQRVAAPLRSPAARNSLHAPPLPLPLAWPLRPWRRESCGAVSERFGLSDREAEVLVLLTRGRTIDQISQELCVSFNTAKSHVRHVYTKTGVHTRKELFSLVREARNS